MTEATQQVTAGNLLRLILLSVILSILGNDSLGVGGAAFLVPEPMLP